MTWNAQVTEASEAAKADTPPATVSGPRIAFERLRERTDELELIISGISLVALVALPSWLFGHWSRLELHAEGAQNVIVSVGFPLAIGLSYTLAGAFLLHLATRAYWVGLIGLKSAFPKGIQWDRVTSVGPLTRDNYRRSVVDLEAAIDSADRFASVVFAVVSLVALSVLWIGGLLLGVSLIAFLIGQLTSISERASALIVAGVTLLVAGVPLAILLLDRGTAMFRRAGRSPSTRLRRVVDALNRVQSLTFPQRLLLPVQLSLESNLPKRTFSIAFALLIAFTLLFGIAQMQFAREFAPVGSYTFMTDDDVAVGLRTAHYENLRGDHDALLRMPMIPSELIADSYLRVFLPHLPERDNKVLNKRCPAVTEARERHACVAGLWTLAFDGQSVDVAAFDAAERRDLGMRGLLGYLAMAGLAPGRHELVAVWNAAETSKRLSRQPVTYTIPFWFAPPYQLDVAPVEAPDIAPAADDLQ